MKTKHGNLFQPEYTVDAIVITTNGTIKKNGECVMGAGVAKTIKEKRPDVPLILGNLIKKNGNIPQIILPKRTCSVDITTNRPWIPAVVSYPVKHNWYEKADINLIKASAIHLVKLTDQQEWTNVWLPVVGCGNGKLLWNNVRPVIEPILDDRFTIIYYGK